MRVPPTTSELDLLRPLTDEHEDRLVGSHVRLVELMPEHYRPLYSITLESDVARRWQPSSIGGTFEGWLRHLTDGVLCQYGVHVLRSGRALDGLVRCYGANFRHGTAQLSVFTSSRTHGRGHGLEAMALLIDMLFHRYPLRKLYAETIEYNLAQFSRGLGRYFEIEGVLKGHELHEGEAWDSYLITITRERWVRFGKETTERVRALGHRRRSVANEQLSECMPRFVGAVDVGLNGRGRPR